MQDLGAFPRPIVSLRVAETRGVASIPLDGQTRFGIQQKWQGPNLRPQSSNVSQSGLRTALNTIDIEFIERCREKRCFREL